MRRSRIGATQSPIAWRYRGDEAVVTARRCSAERRCCCLWAALREGAWRHHQADLGVAATAQQSRAFVPDVRVAAVRASDGTTTVTLPATTTAFEAANIFARTSGYIEKRYVDIGDQVKAGDLLANIVAPELDHQITQAKATLAQNQATLQQTQASRDLAQVTNARDSNLVKQGWLTLQQGDNDRLTLQAQKAAVGVAQSNIAAQEAQIRILEQEKAYQRVVAPFDGVITQRNIDNGSLVTSGSTFMFTLMHSNVIRTQVFVPQDEAFGLGPGVDAVVRVPEIPDRTFPGQGDADSERVAARKPDASDRDRCSQSGRRAQPRNLLHRPAVHSAQDAGDDHTGRRCRIRSKRPACRGGPQRHRAFAEDHDRA